MPKKLKKATHRAKSSKDTLTRMAGKDVTRVLAAPAAAGYVSTGNHYQFATARHPELGSGLKLHFRAKYGYTFWKYSIQSMGIVPYNGGSGTTPDASIRWKPNGVNWPVGLRYLSSMFDQFVFRRLNIELLPQQPTSTPGALTYGYIRDANRGRTLEGLSNNSRLAALAEVSDAITVTPWAQTRLSVPVDDVPRYLGEGSTAITANILLGEAGVFLGALGNVAPSGDTAYHDVYVEGELDLFSFDPYFNGTTLWKEPSLKQESKEFEPPALQRDPRELQPAIGDRYVLVDMASQQRPAITPCSTPEIRPLSSATVSKPPPR